MKRRCLDCTTLIEAPKSRCTHHERANNRTRRPTSNQRGYGTNWRQQRLDILDRDNWTCQIGTHCKQPHGAADEVDHIVPKTLGGTDEPTNLRAACKPCNSAKRDRLAKDERQPA